MPPKKDAFADLFSSATNKSTTKANNLPLSERSKKNDGKGNSPMNSSLWDTPLTATPSRTSSPGVLTPQRHASNYPGNSANINSNHTNISSNNTNYNNSGSTGNINNTNNINNTSNIYGTGNIFSTNSNNNLNKVTNNSNSYTGSGQNTPGSYMSSNEDPFAIFTKPVGGGSLLDDEFTDAFTAPPPPSHRKSHNSTVSSIISETPTPAPAPAPATNRPKDDSRDELLAELIDIGFSVEDANEAIMKKGMDLQACVNYIMSRGDSGNSSRDSGRNSRAEPSRSPDLGINFNELGQTMFSNANKFLSISKKTVMKNLSQFQSHQEQSNVPAWMKTQVKYKSDAVEKKYGIGNEEELDYGSDSENFDHDEIERIIRLQKEREKERAKQRYEKVKEAAMNKVRGKGQDGEQRPQHESSPRNSAGPQHEQSPRNSVGPRTSTVQNSTRPNGARSPASNTSQEFFSRSSQSSENLASRSSPLPSRSPSFRPNSVPVKTEIKSRENLESRDSGIDKVNGSSNVSSNGSSNGSSTAKSTNVASKLHTPIPTKEFDLLGISSHPQTTCSHRVNTPLNQFEEIDYITSKAAAHKAFISGNYGEALTYYLSCLNGLPARHENRVIILSNLAAVYKQLGQLKDSLERIEEGLGLMGTEEISNSNSIASKPVKYWYSKLITTKAEVLELSEKFELSLKNYLILIKELGVVDKKVMDGKRRVDKVVNPDNYKVKPVNKAPVERSKPAATPTTSTATKSPSPTTVANSIDPLEQDRINSTIQSWAQSKQNNLRNLLTNLDDIIPAKIAVKSSLRHLTLNELMLPKQVKIQYMKVISSIHPDKLASQCKGDKTSESICNGVFIILNKTWEEFKQDNSM